MRHIRFNKKVAGNLKTSPYEGETPFSFVLNIDKDISGEKLILTLLLKTPGHEDKLPIFFDFSVNILC